MCCRPKYHSLCTIFYVCCPRWTWLCTGPESTFLSPGSDCENLQKQQVPALWSYTGLWSQEPPIGPQLISHTAWVQDPTSALWIFNVWAPGCTTLAPVVKCISIILHLMPLVLDKHVTIALTEAQTWRRDGGCNLQPLASALFSLSEPKAQIMVTWKCAYYTMHPNAWHLHPARRNSCPS